MSTEVAPLRRRPVQRRSVARVEKMLEACAELIDEMDYDAITTTLIAERAGVAIGSVYQFFPDKHAVVRELTTRNLDTFLTMITKRFDEKPPGTWTDTVATIIDCYIAMHREIPGFSRLHFGDVVDSRLLDSHRDNNAVICDQLVSLIAESFDVDAAHLLPPLSVAVEAADAVLKLAFRRNPEGDQTVVNEAKELLSGYLTTRLDTARIPAQPNVTPSPR